jgi:hypothetical protein
MRNLTITAQDRAIETRHRSPRRRDHAVDDVVGNPRRGTLLHHLRSGRKPVSWQLLLSHRPVRSVNRVVFGPRARRQTITVPAVIGPREVMKAARSSDANRRRPTLSRQRSPRARQVPRGAGTLTRVRDRSSPKDDDSDSQRHAVSHSFERLHAVLLEPHESIGAAPELLDEGIDDIFFVSVRSDAQALVIGSARMSHSPWIGEMRSSSGQSGSRPHCVESGGRPIPKSYGLCLRSGTFSARECAWPGP